jgi:2-polyprenyl-3-methyl-5-hydroxy-6-metoxy-1,4-benzoquinol methylase
MTLRKTATEDSPICMLCGSRDAQRLPRKYMHGSLWRCLDCGLRFIFPRPQPEALKAVYSEEYYTSSNSSEQGYSDYSGDRPNILRTFRRRVKELQRVHPGKARSLDVGCAYGYFLEAASEVGWDAYGIDISRHATEQGRESLGDRVWEGDFLEEELPVERYDIITMWDYLEHVHDPKANLAKACGLLADGGILALATPDVGSLPSKAFGHRWMGYKLDEHLVYFSRSTIRRLLEEAGFRVLRMGYEGKYITLGMFLDRLKLYVPFVRPLLKLVTRAPAVASTSFYLNPRDILLVVAQKSGDGAA